MLPGVSLPDLLTAIGLLGLFAIVFVESGLLVGFFLPGDSLLFTAGLLASKGQLSLSAVIAVCVVAAVAGDQAGYLIGRRFGPGFLATERWFTRPDHVARAEDLFTRRGGAAVLLARFIPIVRTFVPVVAGALDMPYQRFVGWNIAGGLMWGAGITSAGYLLGQTVPSIDRYLLPVIAVIVVLSVVPVWRELRSQPPTHPVEHTTQ
jgi:membrane-associated protein